MTSLADKIAKRRQQAGVGSTTVPESHKKQTHSLPIGERINQIIDTLKLVDYDQFRVAEELYGILTDSNISRLELSKKIGKTQGWISKKLALFSAPDDIQHKIKKGELAATSYYNTTAERVKKITISRSQAVAVAKLFGDIAIKHGLVIELSKKPTKTEILAAFSRVKDIRGVVLK